MVASNPEAFAKLAPTVFDHFKEVNPDGWNGYIAKIVASDLANNDIPLVVMRLADLVQDKPAAVELLQRVSNYLAGFKALANKAPAATPRREQQRQPADTSREDTLRAREWNTDRREISSNIKTDAYTKAMAGRKADAEERGQIEELFNTRCARLADNQFKGWRQKSQDYIRRNDKSGYLRYMESIYRRVIPEAMTSAIASTLRGRTAAPSKKQVAGAKVLTKPAEGFTLIAKQPSAAEINFKLTSPAMVKENKAITISGKKVQWR